MLDAEQRERLSRVLSAARRDRDARAFPLSDLISIAEGLPIDSALRIDLEHIDQPLVLIRASTARRTQRFDALTAREREVAACLAVGLPNREIAARLWLTTATVKDHVHRILAKTGLPNRTAVAAAWNREQSIKN